MMLDIDGFEVCWCIKKDLVNENLFIIFIIVLDQMEDIVKGFELGGVDYVIKFFNKKVLLVCIKNYIDLLMSCCKVEWQVMDLVVVNCLKLWMFFIIGYDLCLFFGFFKLSFDFINWGLIDFCKEDFKDIVIKLLQLMDEGFNLFENLLGWAKLQSDVLIVIFEEIELWDVIESIVCLVKFNLDNKKIQFDFNILEDVWVMVDLYMFNVIVCNLIFNVIKFMFIGGVIIVIVVEDGDEVVIKVVDIGVGILLENLDKIFNFNVQIMIEGINKEGGSGLGLLLVQDFVQKNNGKISVESIVGEGIIFVFILFKA